ncbi:hypothetical protein T8A63_11325 [Sulfitobacter sp. OXR-159]|uniref:hypothetical protein n=1 Tax=Sulfitobacter sp. OXR-159 TaxID=3100174 RepID=UPI002AC9DF3C|nr:hypothetical protein [Sulfitobacter sp. OXR-159]WPZ28251.1 hypothetical protein T8A63_11325 [Sulfitobacter sp. OXR-159]
MKDEEKSVVAAGPRNDARHTYKAGQLPEEDTSSLAESHPVIAMGYDRSSIAKCMPDAYKRVSRCVSYCLLLADAAAWHGLTVVLTARLTQKERLAMAWAVLRSLTPKQIVALAETVLPDATSSPIAPLFNHMDEAVSWADVAEPEALEAYCLASFNAMPQPRQAAFLEFAKGRAAT